MTNFESDEFKKALKSQGFYDFEIEILLATLKGEGSYAQEDILYIHPSRIRILKKLGWYRKVKIAVNNANMKVDFRNL